MRTTITLAGACAGLAILAPLTATPAAAASTHYTHATTLKMNCVIYENLPKSGVPVRAWPKNRQAGNGRLTHVGVRYTYKGYALVLDYARKRAPSWGFIPRSCLKDPFAHSHGNRGARLPDRRAIGGNGKITTVPISARHADRHQRGLIHVGSTGSARSAPRSFVIGNVRKGDPVRITTRHCGHHSAGAWILGHASRSGRWVYIQAAHLPACR